MTRRALFLLLFIACGAQVRAQTPSEPDAQEILRKVAERFNQVHDYSADITAEIKFDKMRFPRMEAMVSFKQPDKMAVEPKAGSFAMIPRDAVGFNPNTLVKENYDAVVQGRETVNGVDCWKVKLLARSDTVRMQRLLLSVDPQYWIVKRVNVTPDKGGTIDALFEHQLQQGKYLMPSKITLTMDVPTLGRMKPAQGAPAEGQKGMVIVTYGNYRINEGISDEVFKRAKVKK